MLSHNRYYCGITTRAPFGAVLVRREFTGKIIVGGMWQNERSIKAVLDELKARLKQEFGPNFVNAGITALIEDSEAGRCLAEIAENTIQLGWTYLFYGIEVMRQSLEGVIPVEGATAKLEIDENRPGGRELAQALENKAEGGMYDALAMCVFQAKEDEEIKNVKEPDVDSKFDPFEF